jgi:hypothetical protein
MGRLDIRIVEARNLPDTQWISKPDPYVIVKLEHQTHRTSVCENNVNPKWEEVFKFTVADENSAQLKFELWNKNVVSDEFLGQYTLSISGLERGVVKDEFYLLQQCKSNAELRVRLMPHDFGRQPAQPPTAQGNVGGTVAAHAQPAPAYANVTPQAQAVPPQVAPQQAYPPHQPQGYAPPPQGYPPQAYPPQQPQGYPPQATYAPPTQGYPPQQYPPQGYPPQQYPPQAQGYPPQQYPPQGYPPQAQGYPPQQYPPQGYPPQAYPPQQPPVGYPPQQPGYPPQPGYGGGYQY